MTIGTMSGWWWSKIWRPAPTCWAVVTEDNSDFHITAKQATPIGHKIALKDLAVGDTVIKYGEDIGKIVAPVAKGEHVHTHNLKTKRW